MDDLEEKEESGLRESGLTKSRCNVSGLREFKKEQL